MRGAGRVKPSQVERVLKAARSFRGTCQADWIAEGGDDGLGKIIRVPRCIEDLEKRDYVFEHIGLRHKTRIYRLVSGPDAESGRRPEPPHPPAVAQPTPALDAERLFEVGKSEHGYADQEAAA
jgi:hypothetical protein